MLTPIGRETGLRISEKGAFKFGAFKLKLHEKNPDAPLSPFFLNIRDKNNPKPGPLDEGDYDLIASCQLEVIRENGLVFDAIAGIPRAGDPIAQAIQRLQDRYDGFNQGDFRVIPLDKVETAEGRRIIPTPGFEYKKGERILLLDDLVTKADTKLEAIRAIEESGCVVVAIVVLVDRQQGGKKQLEEAGYKLYAAFTIKELLDLYLEEGLVEVEKYQEALNYVAANS